MSLSLEQKETYRKAILGFVATFLIAMGTKLAVLIAESNSVALAINYLLSEFPQLVETIVPAVAGGFLAQWKGKSN